MALQKRLEGTTATVPVPNHAEIRIAEIIKV
jgi:hypothetical protein